MSRHEEKRRSLFDTQEQSTAEKLAGITKLAYHLAEMEHAQINGLLLILSFKLSEIKDAAEIPKIINQHVTDTRYTAFNEVAAVQITDLWKQNYYVAEEPRVSIDKESQGDFASLRTRFTMVSV